MSLVLRRAGADDAAFIGEMLAEAASWDRPPGAPPPSLEELFEVPQTADYLESWGRAGDAGLIAESEGRPVGACWFRQMTADRPGYGFIGPEIPSVGLAVVPDHQGLGVGRRLLEGLIALARAQGIATLGISVAERNERARNLYTSAGFVPVGREGDSLTMRVMPRGRQSSSVSNQRSPLAAAAR